MFWGFSVMVFGFLDARVIDVGVMYLKIKKNMYSLKL